MKNSRYIIPLFFFGSLWGVNEALMGSVFYRHDLPYAPVILSLIAFFILAVTRGIANTWGSSFVIGLVAGLYRLSVAGFLCHFLAIVMIGFCFDLFFSLLQRFRTTLSWRVPVIGLITPFMTNLMFVLLMGYVLQSGTWLLGGSAKAMTHVFHSGVLTSLGGLFLVPLGYYLGLKIKPFVEIHRREFISVFAVAGVLFWVAGFLSI